MKDASKKLSMQGFDIIQSFAATTTLGEIEKDLYNPCRFLNFNNECGFSILSGDRWILNPLMYSYTIAKLATDERLIHLITEVFGVSPVIAECSVHISDSNNVELPYHSDRAGGILAYIFLSEMTEKNGQFCLVPGSHHDGSSVFWVPKEKLSHVVGSEIQVACSPGDLLLFDQDIWHRRREGTSGRKVIKILYQPVGKPESCANQLFSQNVLAQMTFDQLKLFGLVGDAQFSRHGLIEGSRVGVTLGVLSLFLKARRISRTAVSFLARRRREPWAHKTAKKFVRVR